jgi:hypothetical protein
MSTQADSAFRWLFGVGGGQPDPLIGDYDHRGSGNRHRSHDPMIWPNHFMIGNE